VTRGQVGGKIGQEARECPIYGGTLPRYPPSRSRPAGCVPSSACPSASDAERVAREYSSIKGTYAGSGRSSPWLEGKGRWGEGSEETETEQERKKRTIYIPVTDASLLSFPLHLELYPHTLTAPLSPSSLVYSRRKPRYTLGVCSLRRALQLQG